MFYKNIIDRVNKTQKNLISLSTFYFIKNFSHKQKYIIKEILDLIYLPFPTLHTFIPADLAKSILVIALVSNNQDGALMIFDK